MKKAAFAVLCLVVPTVASALDEGRYSVTLNRKSNNVYVDATSGAVILTQLCLELALADDAILIWKGKYGSSKVIFDGGEVCDVKDVL